jgi:hypothetical protein
MHIYLDSQKENYTPTFSLKEKERDMSTLFNFQLYVFCDYFSFGLVQLSPAVCLFWPMAEKEGTKGNIVCVYICAHLSLYLSIYLSSIFLFSLYPSIHLNAM